MPHIKPFFNVSILAAVAAMFLFPSSKCNSAMENDVCKALIENNRQALEKAVNTFLRQLPQNSNDQEKFQRISSWIAGLDCVTAVKDSPSLLDTYPPVKQFIITLKSQEQPATIGIRLQKDQWSFNI